MINGKLKSKIDKLWEEFWTGGITNPLTVIEQITYLMFARLLDMKESTAEKKFARIHRGEQKEFPGKFFDEKSQHLRWSQFKHCGSDEMFHIVRDEVFPYFRTLGKSRLGDDSDNTFATYMKDARLIIDEDKAELLRKTVEMIDDLPLTKGDSKGDLYEYLLSKLQSAGINGQFRTPRHIIQLMVDLCISGNEEVAVGWRVSDPSCGTAGFLVGFYEAMMKLYTSDLDNDEKGNEEGHVYTGDQLSDKERQHIQSDMLHGFDFDVTMLRVAAMNLMLHGIESPDIYYQDTLSNTFPERFSEQAEDSFDLILANPPFKGSLDYSSVHPSLTRKVKTKKTELLFLVLMLKMLKPGGRCCVIVPDGVLFGSSNAHRAFREMLIEKNQLDAVISLPSGVFKPYAGVSTAILMFAKDGQTDNVWFYDVQHDGFSLDDKRSETPDLDDLDDVRARWKSRDAKKDTDRTSKDFFVTKEDIVKKSYDLSLNSYKEQKHEEVEYDTPEVILKRLSELELQIAKGREELEEMLR